MAIIELTRDDIIRRLEAGAQRRVGLSAAELVRRYRSGTLEDPCSLADLLALVALLEDDDPLLVSG
jgi:hypothetical protein